MMGSICAAARFLCQMLSTRSSMNGIQPIWLSENATLTSAKRASTPDISQSTSESCELSDVQAVLAARVASGELIVNFDDDPMWIQMTVPVSLHAARNGSQWRPAS